MNHIRKWLAVALSVLMLCGMIPAISLVSAETPNLIKNGDFETGNTSDWSVYQGTAASTAAAKNGSYGVHIKGNGGWGGMLNQTINGLEAGKVYRISLWYKVLSTGVNIKLTAKDGGETYAYTYATKTEWTQFAVEFEATEASAFLNLNGSGTGNAEAMYVDDISIVEVVLGGNDDDPNLKMIDTLMDGIKTQGRTALLRGSLMLDFSISGMEFELDCEGDVYATFNARKLSSSSNTGGAYFTIVVDGVKKARDYCHITTVGETKIKLAEGLSKGKHTFAIYRQTEHSQAEVGVCALSYNGTMLDKPADKDLYIEFIGDSISCGFGDLGNSSQGDGAPLWSDGTQAYTYLTAQALDADWSNVSWSGLGCKYGYSSTTMQQVYPAQRYNYDQATQYDFAKQPDVVILALGTNDNSQGPDKTSIRKGLVEMLTLVRSKNPDAPIVWIHGMMTNGVSSMIEEIVEEFGGADAGYYACRLTQNNSGGGSHPNLAGQKKFADELVSFLKKNGLTEDILTAKDAKDLIGGGETSRMEITANKLGLGFRFDLQAKGVKADADHVADLTNATVDAAGNGSAYKLVSFGAIMSNDVAVGTSEKLMTLDNLSDCTINIAAKYVYDVTDDGVKYAVRITNVPVECTDALIYARPYYVVEDELGNQLTVYDEILYANYADKIDVNDGVLEW